MVLALVQVSANVVGPIFYEGKERFYCLRCDAAHPAVQGEYPSGVPDDAGCVVEDLTGQTVSVRNQGVSVTWDLFVEDPYP